MNGCTDILNCKEISGKIAVLKRGECMFAEKVKRVEDCGSIGAIILDNQPGTRFEVLDIFYLTRILVVRDKMQYFQWLVMV